MDLVLQTKHPASFDTSFADGQGTEKNFNVSIGPITQGDAVTGLVTSIIDISESRRLQGELTKMDKLESLGVLAGGIAHDLNNQLTAIVGSISLAKVAIDEHARQGWLEDAEKGSYRIRDLTQQLLTFSKGGAPVLKPGDIISLLRDATTFALTGSVIAADFDIAEDTWNVQCDQGQVNQVISNLVINARQAMPNGGRISLSTRNVPGE